MSSTHDRRRAGALRRPAAALAVAAALSLPVRAQDPLPALDSLRTGRDSARAMAALDAAVRARPNDHAAWNRRGRLASRMIRTESRIALLRSGAPQFDEHSKAELSLQTAVGLAPDSARYLADLAEYFLVHRYAEPRAGALPTFDRALDVARRVGGPAAFAALAESAGMAFWREYEWFGMRPPGTDFDIKMVHAMPLGGLDVLRNFPVGSTSDEPGRNEFALATALFSAAQRAAPADGRYSRRLLGALAATERWEEARRTAGRVIASDSMDVAGWVALAAGRHRLRDFAGADSAYAVAFSLMSASEHEAFTRLARVLTPADARSYEQLAPAARAAAARRAWLLLDPLWASPGNEYMLEYLSRVATAWLRWESPAPGVHPADAGPGAWLVALGPPQRTVAYPTGQNANTLAFAWLYPTPRSPRGREDAVEVRAKFQRGRFEDVLVQSGEVSEAMRRRRERMPIDWSNVTLAQRVDPADTHVARFRVAGSDSADIYVAAHLPVSRMFRGLELTRAPLGVDLWVMDAAGNRVLRDSTLEHIAPADSAGSSMRVWRKRLPAGSYYYRVEAWQPQALRGARGLVQPAAAANTAMTLRGFGLSDVLVAERVAPRASVGADTRWTDFNIVPNAARLRRGQPYALLWEVYDAAASEGQLRYNVAVTLRKVGAAPTRSFLTQVLSGTGAPSGLKSRDNRGEVRLAYDRVAEAAAVSVNYLVLELGDAPAGEYALDVAVTDQVTKKTAASSVAITVLE